jgi:diacylglycerol O-acyltransferase / wax synthase
VQRLSGLDAGFLYMETPTQHLHTMKVAVVDPTTSPGGYSFERVHDVLASHLQDLPAFRRRLVSVPASVHHPLWVDDAEFDLSRHLRRVRAPEPGDRQALDAVASEVASVALDRRRPLWEIWVVEGLADGEIGFVAKVHHCVADGVRAAEMLMAVLGPDPAAEPPRGEAVTWEGERPPRGRRLLVDALRDRAHGIRAVPNLLRQTARGVRAVVATRRRSAAPPPAPFATESTSFNRALTPRRLFVSRSLDLDSVRSVRRSLDVTVNDVVLAVCAGALRSWLQERGQLPERPLIVGVPVSTRDEFSVGAANRVSNLFVALPVHESDVIRRLRLIHDAAAAAKAQNQALGPDLLSDWSELTPAPAFAAVVRAYSRLNLANRHRPPINLVVSNVPGPSAPLYVAGARLQGLWSMGPILENIGLNITVWSYVDQLNFGLVGCPELTPDLARLADLLLPALEDLEAAAP